MKQTLASDTTSLRDDERDSMQELMKDVEALERGIKQAHSDAKELIDRIYSKLEGKGGK